MCVCEIQYSVSVCVHACDDDDDVCVLYPLTRVPLVVRNRRNYKSTVTESYRREKMLNNVYIRCALKCYLNQIHYYKLNISIL